MINEKDIENLSKLARIGLSDEEKEKLTKDISKILSFVEQIQSANEANSASEANQAGLRNVMREDKNPHEKEKYGKELLEEAPETEDGYVKVQKIL